MSQKTIGMQNQWSGWDMGMNEMDKSTRAKIEEKTPFTRSKYDEIRDPRKQ